MKRVVLLCLVALLAACGKPVDQKKDNNVIIVTDGGGGSDMGASGGDVSSEADAYLPPETCGDGELQEGEQCDGAEVPSSCGELGRGDGSLACDDTCRFDTSGCSLADECSTGDAWCDGDLARTCGSGGAIDTVDCAESGDSCADGACLSGCEAAAATTSHTGCRFVGVQLPNSQGGPDAAFAIVNPGPGMANVTARDHLSGATYDELVGPGEMTTLYTEEDDAIMEIDADAPVAVWQYNAPGNGSSQDSTLLLPRHAWGTSTHIATWFDWDGAFYGVLTDGPNELSGPDGDVTTTGVEHWYTELDADPTGGAITSTEPAQVIGGHQCTAIITSYCDHLEHTLLPDELLGTHYVAGPIWEGETNVPQAIKIVAIEDGTTVDVTGSKTENVSLGAGESATLEWDFDAMTGVDISSNNPVSVTLYSGASRSPSMVALAPESMWRREYALPASPEGGGGFAQVIAAEGTMLEADGSGWNEWTPLDGDGDFVAAHVPLSEATVTHLAADQPVQVVVYGFSSYASFVHLGGFSGGN